ncbi:glycosyltransferase [Stenomitos frigidus]|uniref:Glycosyltransferase n=1 Tax=Stenomitos frigidus ULC18 TaxID=2107698 RepID=A0A2T1E383_9CYAN|nr:glycosyltransferase [Stenomitos frigidus]PSB27202.1 glycosyltransferase [Stenomitos frigidus ULC18]
MTLSLCMIVRDEEATLRRCLASVSGVVDEIIIVDTGSSDRTVSVARACGATVHRFTWCDDFAAARNESLKYAHGDWILVLDADEVLVPESVPALQQAMQPEATIAITLLREELGTNHPKAQLSRLFRRHPAIIFTRPYHELIDDSITALLEQEPHWQVMALPGIAIQHTGYQATAIAQRQKVDRARTIMERYLTAHPDDAYICSKLGALYTDLGDPMQGLALLQRGLDTAIEAPVLYELHYHLGSLYGQLQASAQAALHYQKAIEQPLHQHLKLGAYNNWGNLLKDQGELMKAKTLYETTVMIDPSFAVGYYNLGLTLKAMGQLKDAIAHYNRAIQLQPTYAEAHQNLGVALLKAGSVAESLESFQEAIALYEQQGSPEGASLRHSLQQMRLLRKE